MLNAQKQSQPEFPYGKEQVRIEFMQENELYVISIYIEDRVVNRKLFFSIEEAKIQLYNLELAIRLGARFNDEGYWAFDYPLPKRKELQDEYYRLSKG